MRIYLAGTNNGMTVSERQSAIEEGKPKYILESFINGETLCDRCISVVGNSGFLLDSGAFSFMAGKKISKEELEVYCDRYIKYINDKKVEYFFEIDVDTVFGVEYTEKLRKKIENKTGKQSIPVWHKIRGVEKYKNLVNEYKYISIGGLVVKEIVKKDYPLVKQLIEYANNKGVKVHGLGFTRTEELAEWGWFSVDSTSYAMGGINRQKHMFNGQFITQTKLPQKEGHKIKLERLVKHNFLQWCKYQHFMDKEKI